MACSDLEATLDRIMTTRGLQHLPWERLEKLFWNEIVKGGP